MKMGQNLENLKEKIGKYDDTNAFKRLHELMTPPLANFAESYVNSPLIADEIVSDVMARLWINRQNISTIVNLNAYLFKAIKNESIKYIERERGKAFIRIESSFEHSHSISKVPNPHELLSYKVLESVLEKSISQLPAQCQQVFRLIKNSGLKYKEASEVLGISVKTIEHQMTKALKHIRSVVKSFYLDEDKKSDTKKVASLVVLALLPKILDFFLQ